VTHNHSYQQIELNPGGPGDIENMLEKLHKALHEVHYKFLEQTFKPPIGTIDKYIIFYYFLGLIACISTLSVTIKTRLYMTLQKDGQNWKMIAKLVCIL